MKVSPALAQRGLSRKVCKAVDDAGLGWTSRASTTATGAEDTRFMWKIKRLVDGQFVVLVLSG